MSKRADKEWGEMWSNEKEMKCQVALQTLASCVYTHWRDRYTRDGLCLIAVGLLMIAWEIWFCFHNTEDKNLS